MHLLGLDGLAACDSMDLQCDLHWGRHWSSLVSLQCFSASLWCPAERPCQTSAEWNGPPEACCGLCSMLTRLCMSKKVCFDWHVAPTPPAQSYCAASGQGSNEAPCMHLQGLRVVQSSGLVHLFRVGQ